jgi:hypothetical protein
MTEEVGGSSLPYEQQAGGGEGGSERAPSVHLPVVPLSAWP